MSADFFIRFDRYIQPEPNSGCWFWLGTATPGRKSAGVGYGWFRQSGEMIYAHRAAYEAVHGAGSARDLMVRHSCDLPLCVNPAHLLLGTNADNMRDMRERGRSTRGERSGTSRLTRDQVMKIHHMRHEGASQQETADHFGLDQSAVSLIWSGKRWGYLFMHTLIDKDGIRRGPFKDLAEVRKYVAEHCPDQTQDEDHPGEGMRGNGWDVMAGG